MDFVQRLSGLLTTIAVGTTSTVIHLTRKARTYVPQALTSPAFKNKLSQLMEKTGITYCCLSIYRIGILPIITAAESLNRRISQIWNRSHSSQFSLSPPRSAELVPERWAEDLILRQFTCAINRSPTLKPVGDPTAKTTLYDQNSLLTWVWEKKTSPFGEEMHWWETVRKSKYIIQGLIHHRIEQLKLLESTLGCELSPDNNNEHEKLMENSARKLDLEIRPFLVDKPLEKIFDEMQKIPTFLDGEGHFWLYRCSATGKPIRHVVFPKLSSEVLDEESSLDEIFYEKAYVENLLETQPSTIPQKWPIHRITFEKENLRQESSAMREIKWQVILALTELRQYYKSLEPL